MSTRALCHSKQKGVWVELGTSVPKEKGVVLARAVNSPEVKTGHKLTGLHSVLLQFVLCKNSISGCLPAVTPCQTTCITGPGTCYDTC